MEVAALEQQLAQGNRRVVGVRQEGVLDDDTCPATGLEHLDEVLEEQERRLASADREVLLHLLALLAAKGGIGEDHVHPILVLDVGQVLGQRVGVDDVGGLDAVQDHVHDRYHVGQRLLFLAEKVGGLQRGAVLSGQVAPRFQELEGFAEEAGGPDRAIIQALADPGLDHLDDRPDERARGVVLAAVAPGVAHVFDLCFVEVREFVFLGL